jgi:hypothetical protein
MSDITRPDPKLGWMSADEARAEWDGYTPPSELPPLTQMEEEHEAWQEMCHRIDLTVGGQRVVNNPTWEPVVAQIRYWGEALHQLRLAVPQHDLAAYVEAKHAAETEA